MQGLFNRHFMTADMLLGIVVGLFLSKALGGHLSSTIDLAEFVRTTYILVWVAICAVVELTARSAKKSMMESQHIERIQRSNRFREIKIVFNDMRFWTFVILTLLLLESFRIPEDQIMSGIGITWSCVMAMKVARVLWIVNVIREIRQIEGIHV